MAKKSVKSARRKPDKKSVSKKMDGRQKPSAEALSDQQRQALLFSHARKIKPLLAAKKDAVDAVNQAYELAKKEGITRKEIDLKLQLETGEGIEKAKAEAERLQRVVRWMGVGKQMEMFGESETMAQRHFEDGRRAALDDHPAKPPAHLSTRDADTWLEGHAAGRTTLNTERVLKMTAPNGQMSLGEAAAGVIDKIGGAAPTHKEAA